MVATLPRGWEVRWGWESKLSDHAHLEINFLCTAIHLEIHQLAVPSEYLEVPMS